MHVGRLKYVIIALLNLFWPNFLIASEPSYGAFSLDFVEPLQPGQPSKLEARFVFFSNCLRGDLTITVPTIGADSGVTVTVWSGPIVAYKPITASVAVPRLPSGAYCFRAKCAIVECDNPTPSICEAGRSVWVTTGSAISVPRGFEPDGLAYLLNEIQEGGLSGLTLEEIRDKSPFFYKLITLDPSVTVAGPAKKNDAETLLIAPRTPPTLEMRPVKRTGGPDRSE